MRAGITQSAAKNTRRVKNYKIDMKALSPSWVDDLMYDAEKWEKKGLFSHKFINKVRWKIAMWGALGEVKVA